VKDTLKENQEAFINKLPALISTTLSLQSLHSQRTNLAHELSEKQEKFIATKESLSKTISALSKVLFN
jgi:hypothetical protein